MPSVDKTGFSVGSIERTYPLIANLERYSQIAFMNNYQFDQTDLDAMGQGLITKRMYDWLVEKQAQLNQAGLEVDSIGNE